MRREQKKKRCILHIATYSIIMLWVLLGLVGIFTIMHWTAEKIVGVQELAFGKEIGTDMEKATEEEEPSVSDTEDTPLLVLVNKDNELSENFDPNLQSICDGRLKASGYLYEDLSAMLSDAKEAGYEYWIASAYRSRQRQQELVDEDVSALMQKGYTYEDALTETYRETMPAGHSEHETGLALDILCSGNSNMDTTQADEPGNLWLLTHCSEYGFILRYPADKEDVTGISYEPWHFRYVGKEAAQYIMDNGITLEDFKR
jgi:D-alanyl-D-alanine carboxypeptidase